MLNLWKEFQYIGISSGCHLLYSMFVTQLNKSLSTLALPKFRILLTIKDCNHLWLEYIYLYWTTRQQAVPSFTHNQEKPHLKTESFTLSFPGDFLFSDCLIVTPFSLILVRSLVSSFPCVFGSESMPAWSAVRDSQMDHDSGTVQLLERSPYRSHFVISACRCDLKFDDVFLLFYCF